ncbi:oxidoreductase FAD-binding domain-containing protein [Acetobacter aceti NRIC 0242]|uniref:Hybrid-cluster NAD(P)-dependent oxidoreductase n=1 Tax=Acetobacter aceti NBRC 14818 TaxID=887700 RepID=A0AB33IHS0_ACEAC|nr:hybrid-cluster NAD(P)-dependent oxidoreductase [Acetobacter aceti]TCS32637.1 ferredoxin-NADP reductase [Acetobacter aceti NBRC 14818]BCK77467.1 hybrid-cluster NAD(P)-dependent oxidoreductase [Acetobacter aceti NBRC 14818]GAN57819.1 oxidoreductase FAD-binding subunit [Acetobacter aceti NBRC 14818]GBO82496.1 oxidoreductase FAD-binding domain-containing protein [Acetobacter aceti NRIC 0242]
MTVNGVLAELNDLASAPLWDAERDEVLVCRQVIDETHDVKTFVFSAPQARRFCYRPGQFMTFSLPCGPSGEEINRSYTLSSAPTRPDRVSITVKRVAKGPVSNWLHDTLQPGMEVKVTGPAGEFTCSDSSSKKFLFLSGGSGITPMMSMSRTLMDLGGEADVVFLHSARSPDDLIFARELALMEQRWPDFRASTICESDTPSGRWQGLRGRLVASMLPLVAPDFLEREVYVCGPEPYMAAVRTLLADSGFDMTRHHEESFDFATLMQGELEEAFAAPEPGETTYKVNFTKSRREIECGTDTNILSAARAEGMRVPASCGKGLCGTCKCKLVSGTVEMKHEGGIRQREVDMGMILICCSKPTSDVVIER